MPVMERGGTLPRSTKLIFKLHVSQASYARQLAWEVTGLHGVAWVCFVRLVDRESSWNYRAKNKVSGAYGLGQALPASKMGSVGRDWKTNPRTQIVWVAKYVKERYSGSACKALQHSIRKGWY